MIAVDGKSARGARTAQERCVHLLGAFHADTGVVLGQTVVDGKTNEINAFAPLLDRVPIAGAILTADALHTQVKHVEYLAARHAHSDLDSESEPAVAAAMPADPALGGRPRR